MNKSGDGKNSAREATEKVYHKALEQGCLHFLSALRQYPEAPLENKSHLLTVMDQHLQLIMASVPEIKRSGISKEAVQVERAFKAYIKEATLENYAALEHTLMTLREYNC